MTYHIIVSKITKKIISFGGRGSKQRGDGDPCPCIQLHSTTQSMALSDNEA
eukprot:m.89881 g.89881  ORF g.89881 m.89881 type:complete len:51 (-) comp8840_c0_seq2:1286-1438(-)